MFRGITPSGIPHSVTRARGLISSGIRANALGSSGIRANGIGTRDRADAGAKSVSAATGASGAASALATASAIATVAIPERDRTSRSRGMGYPLTSGLNPATSGGNQATSLGDVAETAEIKATSATSNISLAKQAQLTELLPNIGRAILRELYLKVLLIIRNSAQAGVVPSGAALAQGPAHATSAESTSRQTTLALEYERLMDNLTSLVLNAHIEVARAHIEVAPVATTKAEASAARETKDVVTTLATGGDNPGDTTTSVSTARAKDVSLTHALTTNAPSAQKQLAHAASIASVDRGAASVVGSIASIDSSSSVALPALRGAAIKEWEQYWRAFLPCPESVSWPSLWRMRGQELDKEQVKQARVMIQLWIAPLRLGQRPDPLWASQAEWDEYFMELALYQAVLACNRGEIPVGAVLVDEHHQILAQAGNDSIRAHDPTAHAEMLVLRQAGAKLANYRLERTTLYVTLEPCCMCLMGAIHGRVKEIVYGAADKRTGACGSVFKLSSSPHHNHKVKVRAGVRAEECLQLLQRFFAQRRQR